MSTGVPSRSLSSLRRLRICVTNGVRFASPSKVKTTSSREKSMFRPIGSRMRSRSRIETSSSIFG